MTPRKTRFNLLGTTLAAGALTLAGSMASADQVILDDLIVNGSACIGQDCVNGESFGFDTVRLKENNLRLHFDDTSTSASFPRNDWRFTANDSSNGGASYLAIEDSTASRQVFRVEAGARANALTVDSGGDVGIGLLNAVVDLHIKTGNTPTVRLEQDGSSGFTPQTWDMAGNEANFFIRDATNGSKLVFRIKPNAPTDSIFVAASGNIGMGAGQSPAADLHVRRTVGSSTEPGLLVESTATSGNTADNFELKDMDGRVRFAFNDGSVGDNLLFELRDQQDDFSITFEGTGDPELLIKKSTGVVRIGRGDLEVPNGSVIVGGTTLNVPDYVFADDYDLMPLDQLGAFVASNGHLPNIPSATDVNTGSLNMTQMQMALLEKVEELTLYTLEQQRMIEDLQQQLETR